MRTVHRAEGQVLPIVAIVITVLLLIFLVVIDLGERRMQHTLIEDALQSTTRSLVNRLDYAELAEGNAYLALDKVCIGTYGELIRTPGCAAFAEASVAMLTTNFTAIRGTGQTPQQLARSVRWHAFPTGGTCEISKTMSPASVGPLICAELTTPIAGFGFYPETMITAIAADTVDRL